MKNEGRVAPVPARIAGNRTFPTMEAYAMDFLYRTHERLEDFCFFIQDTPDAEKKVLDATKALLEAFKILAAIPEKKRMIARQPPAKVKA